jgi:hypothetical protein
MKLSPICEMTMHYSFEGILNTTTEQALVRAFACENELATAPV